MTVLRDKIADGQVSVLTREDIREALREYARLYGPDFSQGAFAPAQAKRNGRPELVERYYKGRPDGRPWPSLNAIKSKYDGSWNAARADAGFEANRTGPRGGRRPPGSAEPILHVRERVRYLPSERMVELRRRVERLEERLAAAVERARVADARVRELKARPVREVPVERVRTVTKTVKVKDARAERALERERARLADEQAAHRATADQLRAEARGHRAVLGEVENLRAERAALAAEARAAADERDRTSDRLAAAEARAERLAGELDRARERMLGASEAAIASELVRQADVRADAAEVRAARAEREMAEQAAAITGELRKLTADELAELRRRGPTGPKVLARALERLAVARRRGGTGPLKDALKEVAKAAVMWDDRL